ncbi:MFS transporter [Oscillatoria sp. FACHB-1406]|uniref:MFS transporter n=1 Tax=Oscillatoria sp. FACHB-1406 TaxID=2692846 RepID=UPI0016847D1D|nr:MFS transporter [Oscillatoria sp. FACHB-1406]MBD2578307.1 MFS transporter [Oscillatoria sp. FACHB-1406]
MSEPIVPKSPEREKLSFLTKLSFGSGDLGAAITANILVFYLSPFLTDVAGLTPFLAGASQFVGKVWDAINDPFVGVMSDRTQNQRWGRRYPWMIYGAIPFGLFFFLQWIVPFSAANQWGLFFYYTIISILFNSFYTVVNVPYTSLTPELTQDYDERTNLNSFRFFFSIGGSILSIVIFNYLIRRLIADPQQQYFIMGIVLALISVIPIYLCVWGTHRRALSVAITHPEIETPVSLPILEQLRIVFRNRPFLFVVGIYLCSWLSVQFTASIIPYFIRNRMQIDNPLIEGTVILCVQVTAMAMLPVWSRLSQRFGKRGIYFMGMTLWIIAQAGLYFLQPEQVGLMYALAVMAGFGVSIAYLVPWSMLPDVIELDELNTGQRREGIFYSFITFVQKVCLGLAVTVLLAGLGWAGYDAKLPIAEQPDNVVSLIRFSIGPLPTLSLICGLVLAYFYPLTREIHAQIRLQLDERHRGKSELMNNE